MRSHPRAAWVQWPEWFASRPHVTALVVLIGVNALYLAAVDRLGFILTGVVYVAALMVALRVSPLRAIVIATLCTIGIHYAFYKLLKVPLPWGVLQGIAW